MFYTTIAVDDEIIWNLEGVLTNTFRQNGIIIGDPVSVNLIEYDAGRDQYRVTYSYWSDSQEVQGREVCKFNIINAQIVNFESIQP